MQSRVNLSSAALPQRCRVHRLSGAEAISRLYAFDVTFAVPAAASAGLDLRALLRQRDRRDASRACPWRTGPTARACGSRRAR
jgi:hypothetical protein